MNIKFGQFTFYYFAYHFFHVTDLVCIHYESVAIQAEALLQLSVCHYGRICNLSLGWNATFEAILSEPSADNTICG